jgi:large conductance mechanosensitive channel
MPVGLCLARRKAEHRGSRHERQQDSRERDVKRQAQGRLASERSGKEGEKDTGSRRHGQRNDRARPRLPPPNLIALAGQLRLTDSSGVAKNYTVPGVRPTLRRSLPALANGRNESVPAIPAGNDKRAERGGKMLKEFKEFALRGNLVDLAVGFIIGAAFSGLVQSVVNDLIMPIIGWITGGIDFSNMYIQLSDTRDAAAAAVPITNLEEARKAGATLAYGNFITLLINFIIVAWVLFMVIKAMNRMSRKPAPAPAAPPPPPRQEILLAEIRDLLAKRG